MDIVTALGGKSLFSLYAGIHLGCICAIAISQVVKMIDKLNKKSKK